jgi:hypothetical protein
MIEHAGIIDSPDLRGRVARLMAALKAVIDGRDDDGVAHYTEIAEAAAVPEGWLLNALTGRLCGKLFPGRYCDVELEPDSLFVHVPANFGLRRI